MEIEKLKEIVQGAQFPVTDDYYENSNADGFALLGWAKALLGLYSVECLHKMRNRGYSLSVDYRILDTLVPKYNGYTYILWTCIGFLRALGFREEVSDLMDRLDRIGSYENRMFRYCDKETHYVVPNASSAAALLYCQDGKFEKAKRILEALEARQRKDGNWNYEKKNGETVSKTEDSSHLSMIVYHLREIRRFCVGVDVEPMIRSAVRFLAQANSGHLRGGKIGWGKPMLYLATAGIDEALSRRALGETLSESLSHPNFRTRSYAAWALVMGSVSPPLSLTIGKTE